MSALCLALGIWGAPAFRGLSDKPHCGAGPSSEKTAPGSLPALRKFHLTSGLSTEVRPLSPAHRGRRGGSQTGFWTKSKATCLLPALPGLLCGLATGSKGHGHTRPAPWTAGRWRWPVWSIQPPSQGAEVTACLLSSRTKWTALLQMLGSPFLVLLLFPHSPVYCAPNVTEIPPPHGHLEAQSDGIKHACP